MFKLVAIVILLAAFAAQTLDRAAIVVNYYANKASYASKCENKAKPMLHCNGRCQMLKKLKQAEGKEKQNPERRNDRKQEVLSSRSFFASLTQLRLYRSRVYRTENNKLIADISGEIFHPPCA